MKKLLYIIISSVSLLTLATPNACAQTYVLNPHQAKIGSVATLPMNAADHNSWLTQFYKQVPIAKTTERSKIGGADGESLESTLKKASQAYLELQMDEAQAEAAQAVAIIFEQWPYTSMQKDIQEAYGIQLMAIDSEASETSLNSEAMSFADQNSFAGSLSIKTQSAIAKIAVSKVKLGAEDFSSPPSRVLVFGQEVRLPITLKTGRWLIHALIGDEVVAYSFTASKSAKLQKLWSRSLWKNLPHSAMKTHLVATRPSHLMAAGVTVIVKEGNDEPTPLSISTSGRDTLVVKKSTPMDPTADPLSENFNFESDEGGTSIFKSPWFWVITATVAGLGGYYAYHSSHSTVTTR